jgi:hypothetical protein
MIRMHGGRWFISLEDERMDGGMDGGWMILWMIGIDIMEDMKFGRAWVIVTVLGDFGKL